MEVSNEIKEDIRKNQLDLKNAIRTHQVWVARLQEDENNLYYKSKVKEAEKEIIIIGQNQKLVVDRLRRELELYQQRLKTRNKQVNIENDNRYVAQQLRDHQNQYRNRNRPVSLLKPSVLSKINIKGESHNDDVKENISDTENKIKISDKDNNLNEAEENEKCQRNYMHMTNTVHNSRNNFANALNKVKESLINSKIQYNREWQDDHRSDSDSCHGLEPTPSPSPPPLPGPGEPLSQEIFMRLLGLVTPLQKEFLEKKRNERRKRSTTSTNRNDFLYGNYDMLPKRKKQNHFPYLQSHNDPPQTRSAKLRKQQGQNKSSREGSPSGSSTENKSWSNGKPSWAASLPAGLTVQPVHSPSKKVCHGCGRNDVPSLLVWCSECSVWQHTGCGIEGRCFGCQALLPDPADCATSNTNDVQLYRDKLAERKRLQEKNIQLCVELRKLEARASSLKENLDEHNAEKGQLLAVQIKTQRNLQKLLDFISQFKETSLSVQSTSVSESGSEMSKSPEE